MVNALQVFIKTAAVSGIGLFWANFTIEAFKFAWHITTTSPKKETYKAFCENCEEYFEDDEYHLINGSQESRRPEDSSCLKKCSFYKMASIAIMIGGAVLNAAAFTGGNYLAKYIAGDSGQAALAEKTRHDKALEAYQAAMEKYTRERTQLLDWIETNREIKSQADQNFTNTDYAFKLYNQAHPNYKLTQPTKPNFSDMYQPSELQKQGELLFVGWGTLELGYAAFRFL